MATTTTTSTIDLAHLVHMVTDHHDDGLGHRAECSCGWASEWTDDPATAETAGVDHREVAAGAGDGLDAVMGELLDIQDDLAGMVVWLAENWSADLPVPTVYGFGGGTSSAHVELSAYCVDARDLVRIAHLLGAVPDDEDEPNPHTGSHYRRASRRFGRVTLEAFTTLAADTEPAS
jgi:hypothetical protein